MTVDTQNNAVPTPTQDKVDAPVTTAKVEINEPTTPTTNEEDPNWKAFREARKKDREQREAAERRAAEKEAEANALKAAMEAAFSRSAPSPQAYQQYYGMPQHDGQPDETEEQRIEKKVNDILAAKEAKFRQETQEREQREYPERLRKQYPDIDYVTAQENLDYLDYHYPEVSRPLQRLQDGFDKWSDIYHAVKKFVPNHSSAKREAQRAEINQNKPKSISSATQTNPGEPIREDWQAAEQRRAANWARMQKVLKGV